MKVKKTPVLWFQIESGFNFISGSGSRQAEMVPQEREETTVNSCFVELS
jgi:hypothetical protein